MPTSEGATSTGAARTGHTWTHIAGLLAWEALDSRGTPTVACEVRLEGGATGSATVPSGASTGSHEAVELRDGGERYGGKGVRRAVGNVSTELADAVRGLDALAQEELDAALRAADGTADLSRLGANAVLAVSVAAAIAAASATGQPLYRSAASPPTGAGAGGQVLLPLPMVNVLSGGAHAGDALDIQDVLVVPLGATSFAEAIEWAWRVRRATAEVLSDQGLASTLVADEGGLGPVLASNRAALEVLSRGIERSGLVPGDEAAIAVDIAANRLHDPATGKYHLASEGRTLEPEAWVAEVATWLEELPVVSLEDVMAEDDWDGWALAARQLSQVQLLGDDLFVTDTSRLARGIRDGVANAVLVKANQTGTLSSARAVVVQAQQANFATVISARSGDTEDSWLADLAVAWRTGQIKVGSTTRSERTAKWNRLLRIEAECGESAAFAGRAALAPLRRS
jgi:enolase